MKRLHNSIKVAMLLALAAPSFAQSGGGYVITKSTNDSGGGTVTGGTYVLSGTVGQHDAGSISGGPYALEGGFWPGAAAAPCTCQLYADIAPDGGDCIVELADVICVLTGYSGAGCPQADIAPCGGDGLIELADIIAVLGAYSDVYLCEHPCAP